MPSAPAPAPPPPTQHPIRRSPQPRPLTRWPRRWCRVTPVRHPCGLQAHPLRCLSWMRLVATTTDRRHAASRCVVDTEAQAQHPHVRTQLATRTIHRGASFNRETYLLVLLMGGSAALLVVYTGGHRSPQDHRPDDAGQAQPSQLVVSCACVAKRLCAHPTGK
jgi:hypothetical protein